MEEVMEIIEILQEAQLKEASDIHLAPGTQVMFRIDGKLVQVGNLRILGLGGCPMYNGGPHQYTEKQMHRRIAKLGFQLYRRGGVDIVVTHAPVRDYGDAPDPAHRGFEAFQPLLDKYKPQYLVHGHVHLRYGHDLDRIHQYGGTTLINACERYILEIPDK